VSQEESLWLPEELDQRWWHSSADTDQPIITASPYKPRHNESATLLSSQMIEFWSSCWSDCVCQPRWWCGELVVFEATVCVCVSMVSKATKSAVW